MYTLYTYCRNGKQGSTTRKDRGEGTNQHIGVGETACVRAMASTPRPPWLAACCLRAGSVIVDAWPVVHLGAAARTRQAICRFLLQLFLLDVFGWVSYKIIQFEAILQVMAVHSAPDEGFAISRVLFVTLLGTLEVTIETIASALVPRSAHAALTHDSTADHGALRP